MLATRIRQKDGIFYFVSFKARDILSRVKFTSRFYFEGATIEAEADADDPIAKFIGSVERSEKAFQRMLSRRKVRHHQFDPDAHQQIAPGRPAGSYQPLRRRDASGRVSGAQAVRGNHFAASIQDQPSRRPQPAGEMDSASRAIQ